MTRRCELFPRGTDGAGPVANSLSCGVVGCWHVHIILLDDSQVQPSCYPTRGVRVL